MFYAISYNITTSVCGVFFPSNRFINNLSGIPYSVLCACHYLVTLVMREKYDNIFTHHKRPVLKPF